MCRGEKNEYKSKFQGVETATENSTGKKAQPKRKGKNTAWTQEKKISVPLGGKKKFLTQLPDREKGKKSLKQKKGNSRKKSKAAQWGGIQLS